MHMRRYPVLFPVYVNTLNYPLGMIIIRSCQTLVRVFVLNAVPLDSYLAALSLCYLSMPGVMTLTEVMHNTLFHVPG